MKNIQRMNGGRFGKNSPELRVCIYLCKRSLKCNKTILDNHYLDHAGTALYSEKQLKDSVAHFNADLFCNPHTSKTTEDLIDQVRFRYVNKSLKKFLSYLLITFQNFTTFPH